MGDTGTAKTPAGTDEVVPVGPDDEGLGNVRPDEVVPIGPDDEGLGNVRPDEVVPIGPDDEGLGNVRPAVIRVEVSR